MTKDIEHRSYEVGYGKPPKATQFKPGESGNRRGRPKKQMSLRKKVDRLLQEELALTVNGQRRRIPLEDAYLMGLRQGLLDGPVSKRMAIFKFLQSHRSEPEEETEWDYSRLNDEELDQLEALMMKLIPEK